ncbi:MAG: leucine-rich repeat protein [Clostridia bacterium]|nr:leucine-rich repeat protein [Clostridia bacterium]
MKKFISGLLSIVMLFTVCFSSVVFAEETAAVVASGACGNDTSDVTWTLYDDGLITFLGTGTIKGYNNGEQPWYSYMSQITEAVFGEGLTRVPPNALYAASNLTTVTIGSSVTEIWSNAFNSCSNLATLNYTPATTCTIGDYAFNATKFANLVIPEGVTSIGQYAFNNLQGSLRSVVLPNTLTTISSRAFRNAGNLESVTIPQEVTTIAADAFEDDGYKIGYDTVFYVVEGSAAETFAKSINSTNTSYAYTYSLVDGCGVAGNIGWVLNDNVLTISGTGAIPAYDVNTAPWASLKDEIRTVLIGEGVTAIGASAFKGAANVKTVQLPSTLTAIGANAFDSSKPIAVVIPDSVTSVADGAFADSTELCVSTASSFKDTEGYAVWVEGNSYTNTSPAAGSATINYAVYKNGEEYTLVIGGSGNMAGDLLSTNAPWYANYGDKITTVVVDYGVTRVAGRLFLNNKIITSVSLADSVTGIQSEVFSGCSGITSLNMSNRVTTVGSRGFSGISVTEIEIPATITSIGGYGFSAMGKLKSLEIPEGMTTIPTTAFTALTSITELKIPSSVTTIEASAFYNCGRLEKIYIPSTCTTIAADAFKAAGYLLEGYVANSTTPTTIYCTKDSAAYTFATTSSYGYQCVAYTASGTAGELEWTLSDGVLTIEGTGVIPDYTAESAAPWAAYADKITDISLADTITGIGTYAFAGLTQLTKVNVPATVTAIGDNAFAGCTKLVILAEMDSAAAKYAQENSIALIIGGKLSNGIEWGIKDGVLTVTGEGEITEKPWDGKDIFVNDVHTVVVGEGITKIAGRAFERGVAIETVLLPSTATYIDHSILNEAPSLEFAEIPAGVTYVGSIFGSQGMKRLALLNNTDTKISDILKDQVRDDLTVIVTAENTAIKANSANSGIDFETVKANGATADGMLRWIVTEEGSLDIYGSGDLSALAAAPWADYASTIENVYIHEGITGVGTGLFTDISGAYIELADSITALGENAISGQNNKVRVPVYVKDIATGAFGTGTTIMGYKNSYAKTYAETNSITFDERSSLRMLAIGNSYTEDMCEWIYKMADEAGIEDVVVANLMYPGRNLKAIYEHIQDNDTDYIYYKHTHSVSRSVTDSDVNILHGLTAEDWDIIALQAWYPEAAYGLDGIEEGEPEWLTYITDYIKANATNPNVELAFNMVWAQEREVSDHVTKPTDYALGHNRNNYGDTVTEYNRIAAQTKEHFVEDSTLGYTYVLPVGTGIENARTSYLAGIRGTTLIGRNSAGNLLGGLQRDSCHLNYLGKYIADLIWMDMLTDVEIDDITYTPEVTYTDGTEVFDADVVAVAKEAAKAAVAKPYEITASSSPFRIMSYTGGNATIAASNVVRTLNQDTATEAKSQAATVVFAEYTAAGELVQCVPVDTALVYDEEISSAEYLSNEFYETAEYTKNIIPDGAFEPTAGNTVKVMLWDSLNGLTPLADCDIQTVAAE